MKRLFFFVSLVCLMPLASCTAVGGGDLVSQLCAASDRGDTLMFVRGVDSLQAAASGHPAAYAELALVFRHRWAQQVRGSVAADREALRMCIYHRVGKRLDSLALRSRYEAYRPGMYDEMERVAGSAYLREVVERMMARMDGHLQAFIARARLSAYELVAELEMQFPGLVNNMERALEEVIRSLHDVVKHALDSINS